MASSKSYSYYLKGNKIAIIEDNITDNDEFKRQLEKGVSALKRGPYIVQGFKEMR